MTGASPLYASFLAREFPAQALLRLRPELRGHPCVVLQGDPPLQESCSLNRKARATGLVCGMTRVEVDTFPDVVTLSRSLNEEASTKAALLECAGRFSPRIEDQSADGVFLCVVDIAGTGKLFGPPEMLVRNLLTRIADLGVTACAAVSCNFHAAIALAKGLPPQKKLKVIQPGEEADALASLPLEVLGLTEAQAETFSLWGIRTLGMLAALPEKELISRMGQPGKRLRQLARGEMPHLFQPVEPAFSLKERMELDSPVELLDALLFVINLMLEQLVLRATDRVLALASVTVALTLEGGAIHTRTVRPALPTNERKLWIKLLHLDLEIHPPAAIILAVALEAEPGSTSKVQLGLFSPQLPEPSRLDVTLARIQGIVGEENVGRAVLKDTHHPNSFRMEPFSIPSTTVSEIPPVPPRHSMRMLRPPDSVFVTLHGQRPKAFLFRDHRYIVDRAYGPWLTSGEWWSETLWKWEQWDLAAHAPEGGALFCCLVCDRVLDRWQMVALYD